MFKQSNLSNTEMFEIKNEVTPINKKNSIQINNMNNNNSNIYNKSGPVNNNNSNYNFINQKSLIRSSSLPELNQMNSRTNLESSNIFNAINNLNINSNNDLNIKNSFNLTNYNNSNFMSSIKYNNMNNFIKTSSSFKNLFFKEDNPNIKEKEEDNIIPNYTTKQFFKKFNPKNNLYNLHKKGKESLIKMQNFNSDILKNNNWGAVMNNQSLNFKQNKPLINSVKKNYFNKTLNDRFRVRSNVNETYVKKMRIFDKISLRSQSTDNKNEIKKIVFNKNKSN